MERRIGRLCQGCGLAAEIQCDYLGRDRLRCTTAWCSEHAIELTGQGFFCRRHAKLQAALHEGVTAPTLHNRAPSLMLWIVEDIDSRVRSQATADMHISPIPMSELAISVGLNGWEAGWQFRHSGGVSRVTVFVADAVPTHVNLRINERLVPVGVPPWIEQRSTGLKVELEQELRDMFQQRLFSTILFAFQMDDVVTRT